VICKDLELVSATYHLIDLTTHTVML